MENMSNLIYFEVGCLRRDIGCCKYGWHSKIIEIDIIKNFIERGNKLKHWKWKLCFWGWGSSAGGSFYRNGWRG